MVLISEVIRSKPDVLRIAEVAKVLAYKYCHVLAKISVSLKNSGPVAVTQG